MSCSSIERSFSLIITDEYNSDLSLSNSIKNNISSLKSLHPELRHSILRNDDVKLFLSSHFSTDVLEAYNTLAPYAFKADLAKYCLLAHYGGLYADLSIRLIAAVSLPSGKRMACFRDAVAAGTGLWTVSTGLIYSARNLPELTTAIDMIVHNCENKIYGANPLHPTGPALFGRACASNNNEEYIDVGEFVNFTGNTNPHNYGYINSSGRIIALRMKTIGADIAHLGIVGSNNYSKIWHSMQAYGENKLSFYVGGKVYTTDNCIVLNNAASIRNDANGILAFGPYISLFRGSYLAQFVIDGRLQASSMTIDIASGDRIIASRETSGDSVEPSIEFRLEMFTDNIEVRLSCCAGSSGTFYGLVIERFGS